MTTKQTQEQSETRPSEVRSNALLAIQAVVDAQAKDDGLWFNAKTCPEAYLQQELRKLHAVIERHTKLANA